MKRKEFVAVMEEQDSGRDFSPSLNDDPLYPRVVELFGEWSKDHVEAFVIAESEQSISTLKRLAADSPSTWLYWSRLGEMHYLIAEKQHATGNSHDAQQSQRAALDAFRTAQDLKPTCWINNTRLALFLANAIHEEFRRPREAYQLARADYFKFSNRATADAFAFAQYRTGQYANVIETLAKAQARGNCPEYELLGRCAYSS